MFFITKQGDRCEWRILATHGEKIVLNLTSLDIPSPPASLNTGDPLNVSVKEDLVRRCGREDVLEVRDGYWHRSPLLGKE